MVPMTLTKMTNKPFMALTQAQSDVFRVVRTRQNAGKITTRADIEKQLDMNDKSWTCRILKALIEKGAIERYDQRYYKLPDPTE